MRRVVAMVSSAIALLLAGCDTDSTGADEAAPTKSLSSQLPVTSSVPASISPTMPEASMPRTNRPAGLVESSSWTDGPWPFTVEKAILMCTEGIGGQRVTVTAGPEMYALNGSAKAQLSLPDFDAIWRDDPAFPGIKVDIGPMLNRGLSLCS